ncbi:hypothetical protein K435DRAFT_963885 [Dendrothele bispora CBS 962.96]|uniref:Uncharacterized protein n=1 Tax=Dendrothele bispora (strain CBS 962.96) TaxID=1314807 RepID=A0A4V4HGZ6_DENBC|nr:hypothetical protein K435DRAFT_963885 [Dendrothele bispora CBS 962.96]
MSLQLHRKLISEPFGPYPETKILTEEFAHPLDKDKAVLDGVYMEMDRRPTGLEYTEFIEVAPRRLDVRFFGILIIEKLAWLSEQGYEWLQKDLRERDARINGVKSGLTLKTLYGSRKGEGSRIKVWIQCQKVSSARYLTDVRRPGCLFLISKWTNEKSKSIHYNEYRIQSLDAGTLSLSKKFLSRFRLLAFVKMAISEENSVPVEERTVAWLVDQMLAHHHELGKKHRYVFDADSDSDVDQEGNTDRPRRLRHVTRAEVQRLLARHAEWFLAQQIVTSRKSHHLVNLPDLYKFCCNTRRDGKPNLGRFGVNEWEKKVRNHCTHPKKSTTSSSSSRVHSALERRSPTPVPRVVEFEYDSDFSVDSSESEHDSDSDIDSAHMELCRQVPAWCLHPPQLTQFRWDCPGCDYSIDLRQPPAYLPPGDRDFLEKTPWRLSDAKVTAIVVRLTSDHYHEHLRHRGVDLVWRNGKAKLISWPEESPMEGIEVGPNRIKEEMD